MRVHISLNVRSLDRSVRFYGNLLGQEPSKQRDGYTNFRLDQPPIHLALQASSDAGRSGASHYGIELPDHAALQAWRSRLEDAGLDVLVEDASRCCYATADKLWLSDPDGNRWEIWVRTGEHPGMGSTRAGVGSGRAECCAA